MIFNRSGKTTPWEKEWLCPANGVEKTEYACMLNHFSHAQLFVILWTVACQTPLSMGFSRQEYWSGSPCPPSGYLPNPGIEPGLPALQADSYGLSHQDKCVRVLLL